jgi:16S rRNA C967 or C1407 C5-methylase (RsmB/RsmF family)
MSDSRMVRLPDAFLKRMQSLLVDRFANFEHSFREEVPVAVRINPHKWMKTLPDDKVPWCTNGCYLKKRPLFTADPWLHGGAYYVQEPHSMFLEQAFISAELPEKALILDLCAAPGGKTTHLLSLLRPGDLLVSNEVIRSRSYILLENVTKWGSPDVVVTRNDPQDFGALAEIFDLVVTDVPCSGEGLFRKDPGSVAEWSPENTGHCALRQQRILSEAWKCLKPGGYLIYSTCTYNPAENEENLKWLSEQEEAEPVKIAVPEDWNISHINHGNICGYQFYPHMSRGEGFFLGMVRKGRLKETNSGRKLGGGKDGRWKDGKGHNLKVPEIMLQWINPGFEGIWFQKEGIWHSFPTSWSSYLPFMEKHLTVLQAGTPVATQLEKQFIPHPALALSRTVKREVFPEYTCSHQEAIAFLRKENLPARSQEKGWMLVTFMDLPLGWLKNLGNRTNNYYPGEWRIRMDIHGIPQLWHWTV